MTNGEDLHKSTFSQLWRRPLFKAGFWLIVFVAVYNLVWIVNPGGLSQDELLVRDATYMTNIAEMKRDYATVNDGKLIGPYAVDASGSVNFGLSFRVNLLPFACQHVLYEQIDLTQPWDSPANTAATAQQVAFFERPGSRDRTRHETPYRVFHGGGALFEADGAPVKLTKIPDGAANTVLLVHATEAVPWAKPQEFAYTPTTPLPPLGSKGLGDGFHAAMADGSVRFVRSTIAEAALRGLIEKADGRGANID